MPFAERTRPRVTRDLLVRVQQRVLPGDSLQHLVGDLIDALAVEGHSGVGGPVHRLEAIQVLSGQLCVSQSLLRAAPRRPSGLNGSGSSSAEDSSP
jgi:hypothetical protein